MVFKDYARREKVIQEGKCPSVMLVAYRYMNEVIDEELASAYSRTRCYAPQFDEMMKSDISYGVPYEHPYLNENMSRSTYNKLKRFVIDGVTKRLAL